MNTLKALAIAAAQIEVQIIENDGELTPELESSLQITSLAMSDKVDSYALVTARIDQTIEYHKALMKEHAAYVDKLEKTKDKLLTALGESIEMLNVQHLKGNEYLVRLRQNPPKVDIVNEDLISDDYKKVTTTTSVDKKKIAEALKLGVDVEGARLVQTKKVEIKTKTALVEDAKETAKINN